MSSYIAQERKEEILGDEKNNKEKMEENVRDKKTKKKRTMMRSVDHRIVMIIVIHAAYRVWSLRERPDTLHISYALCSNLPGGDSNPLASGSSRRGQTNLQGQNDPLCFSLDRK